ncbi:hypothetical protein P8C59_000936 [Phyllachora maydis]|uniref:Uncharacterized protein n=1 Tax=Phyllachora maydis TaxID=1825666 RepID=A0AAD9HYN4_9PEZI|nr:hypothetical protein P8C59_000936 [Phyllachora maydis]
MPLALAPTPTKPAKITPAIYYVAACKAKQRKSAKAHAIAGRAAATKRRKKRKKARTTSSNAGRYTTNSSLIANKDNNNAYNRAYIPPANTEEEEGSSSNNNSVNSSTSDSTDKSKGSSIREYSKGALRRKNILLPRPIIAHYLKVLIASKPTSA